MPYTKATVIIYLALILAIAAAGFMIIVKDMMPRTNNGQFQVRIKAPYGTRLERTEEKLRRVLQIIDKTVNQNVAISSDYVGLIPSSYGTSNLYIFNTGTQEAIFFFNDTATTEIYTLSLHDALPI